MGKNNANFRALTGAVDLLTIAAQACTISVVARLNEGQPASNVTKENRRALW